MGIEVVHFAISVLITKVVTLWAQEQEATIGLFEDYSGEMLMEVNMSALHGI